MRRPGGRRAAARPARRAALTPRLLLSGYLLASMLLIALIPLENGSSPCSGT